MNKHKHITARLIKAIEYRTRKTGKVPESIKLSDDHWDEWIVAQLKIHSVITTIGGNTYVHWDDREWRREDE